MTRGEKVIAFIERHLIVPDGVLRGQPFRLLEFQKRFILEVYDNPAGTRHAILSIGRKNGKTALMACLVLAHLCGPEAQENSQIESGARSRDQAAKLYKYAADIARMSPDIRHRVRPIPSAKMLIGLKKNVEYKALAAEAASAHGGTPILALRDEVGQVKGPTDDFFTAMETSQGAHENPLLIDISTQAANDGCLLSITIDDALKSNDPQVVCHLYAADEDADLLDEAQWRKANPAMGEFRSYDDIARLARAAKRQPTKENDFRNLYLNQRVSVFDPFVTRLVWQANASEPEEEAFRSGVVFGGLDLSQTTDLTALVLVARHNGRWHVRPTFWMASELIEERARRDRQPYDVWARKGYLRATKGRAVDYSDVARDIGEITAGMNVAAIAYDRYGIEGLKRHLQIEGVSLPLEPWGQGFASMGPAVAALEVELLHERLAHGCHPVLTICAANAVVQRDAAGNRKLDKAKSTGRIDGMVALAMAIGAAVKATEEAASVYESRGLLML